MKHPLMTLFSSATLHFVPGISGSMQNDCFKYTLFPLTKSKWRLQTSQDAMAINSHTSLEPVRVSMNSVGEDGPTSSKPASKKHGMLAVELGWLFRQIRLTYLHMACLQ